MEKTWLQYRLRLTAERIEGWRREADRLRAVAGVVHGVSELIEVEETATAIYREIEAFNSLVSEIDQRSPTAAGEIAAVGDALRLVLLELTELSLLMYRLEGDRPGTPPPPTLPS